MVQRVYIIFILAFGLPLFIFRPADGFSSRGRINSDFSYESLEVRSAFAYSRKHRLRYPVCAVLAYVVNESREAKENITVTFSAYNIFDELLFEVSSNIKKLEPGEKHRLNEKISCNSKTPYRWESRVSE